MTNRVDALTGHWEDFVGGGAAEVVKLISTGLATYSGYGTGYTAYATPTDMLTLSGSDTKVIRINSMTMRIGTTAAALQKLFFVKRTAANTGGTSSTPTPTKLDTTSPAAAAVLRLYTAAPAGLGAGTTLGESNTVTTVLTAAPAAFQLVTPFPMNTGTGTGIILRGAAEFLCLNWNGAALPGGFTATWEVLWTEEDY